MNRVSSSCYILHKSQAWIKWPDQSKDLNNVMRHQVALYLCKSRLYLPKAIYVFLTTTLFLFYSTIIDLLYCSDSRFWRESLHQHLQWWRALRVRTCQAAAENVCCKFNCIAPEGHWQSTREDHRAFHVLELTREWSLRLKSTPEERA